MADLTYGTGIQRRQGGDYFVAGSTAVLVGPVLSKRQRNTVAEVNAGISLLPALPGFKYRMVDAALCAIGGAVGATTTVDIIGTQSSAVKLLAGAQANLTQNTLIRAGATGGAVLAAGASFVANDANTAITLGVTGSAITVATHIDTTFVYVIEEA